MEEINKIKVALIVMGVFFISTPVFASINFTQDREERQNAQVTVEEDYQALIKANNEALKNAKPYVPSSSPKVSNTTVSPTNLRIQDLEDRINQLEAQQAITKTTGPKIQPNFPNKRKFTWSSPTSVLTANTTLKKIGWFKRLINWIW
jgi:hypothetical protein